MKKRMLIISSPCVVFFLTFIFFLTPTQKNSATSQMVSTHASPVPAHVQYDNKIQDIVKKMHHVAIIPDGNRRWAQAKNMSPLEGHKEGFLHIAPLLINEFFDYGIHTVTFWCFSTGNWDRSKKEVDNFMYNLFPKFVDALIAMAIEKNVKMVHLGRKDRIPSILLQKLNQAENQTAQFTQHILNIGIDYSGPDEVCRALKKIQKQDVSEDELLKALDNGDQPYPCPDVIIRSSGEQRLSGFMAIQSTYAELIFEKKHFPDFSIETVKEIIIEFGKRKRTFSK